jgi:phosphoadenosine phosphosulfate reductase
MDELERRQHLLHSQLPAFQRKLTYTKQVIADALEVPGKWYVAYSSGIDSLVMLDLIWQSGACVPVLWGDDAWDYPETLDFLTATERRYGFHLTRIRSLNPWRDWCVEMDRPDLCEDPAALSAWHNPHAWNDTWHSLTRDAPSHDYSGVFLGLLAKESRSRNYALRGGLKPLYQVKSEGGMWHCSPLAAWDKRDVWAYVVSRNLPYNPVYDKLAALGVPLERRRVAALTCFRVMQYGSVTAIRQGWPDLYNELASTFANVRSYA